MLIIIWLLSIIGKFFINCYGVFYVSGLVDKKVIDFDYYEELGLFLYNGGGGGCLEFGDLLGYFILRFLREDYWLLFWKGICDWLEWY